MGLVMSETYTASCQPPDLGHGTTPRVTVMEVSIADTEDDEASEAEEEEVLPSPGEALPDAASPAAAVATAGSASGALQQGGPVRAPAVGAEAGSAASVPLIYAVGPSGGLSGVDDDTEADLAPTAEPVV